MDSKNFKNYAINILHGPSLLFYDNCLFYWFLRLVVNLKIKSEKSKVTTFPKISRAPRSMKNYNVNTEGYISFEWLSAKSV